MASSAGKRKEIEPLAPLEIMLAFFELLDARSLGRAAQVCREWRALAKPLIKPARLREGLVGCVRVLDTPGGIIRDIATWKDLIVGLDAQGFLCAWNADGTLADRVWSDGRSLTVWGDILVAMSDDSHVWLWKKSGRDGPERRSGTSRGILSCVKVKREPLAGDGITWILGWGDTLAVGKHADFMEFWDESCAVAKEVTLPESSHHAVSWGDLLATAFLHPQDVILWDKAGTQVHRLNALATRLIKWKDGLITIGPTTSRSWNSKFEPIADFSRGFCDAAYANRIGVWNDLVFCKYSTWAVTRFWKASSAAFAFEVNKIVDDVLEISISGCDALAEMKFGRVILWGVPE